MYDGKWTDGEKHGQGKSYNENGKLQYDGGALSSPLNNEYVVYMLAENQSAEVAWNMQHYYLDN